MSHAVLAVVLLVLGSSAARAYDCPKPSQQFVQDSEVHDTTIILAAVGEQKYNSVAKVVTTDLFSKYPNADKVVIAHTMLSMFCQVIMGSAMSTEEKLDRLYRLDGWITYISGRSAAVRADSPTCATDPGAVLRPIRSIFQAWTRLDVEAYLEQWAPNALRRAKAAGVFGKGELAQRRRADFARFSRVAVWGYSPTIVFADGRKAVVNNRYTMQFQRRNGTSFMEQEVENYTLECFGPQRRWLIRENNDYLPEWVKS